jgi:hypothetical protein
MAAKGSSERSPVNAVQAIYAALEPLDEETRKRVVASALSLLGMEEPRGTVGHARSTERQTHSESKVPARVKSPVELIQEKNPATNSQRIALFAYHRERYEGDSRFSRADLKSYFGKAKEPPPANYDRDFAAAVRQGWIHEDGAESYLTSKGLEAVEAGFGGKARPRGRAAKKKGHKKRPGRTKSAKQ